MGRNEAWGRPWLSLLGLVAIAASGCSLSGPHLSFAVEQRILRETTLNDMPEDAAEAGDGVVRVIHMGHQSSGSCSGTLVGSRHVMTAAHCVFERDAHHELVLTKAWPHTLHVELGGDYLPWGRVGVVHVRACDGYDGDLEHDLAMLVLAMPVPASVWTLELGYDVAIDANEAGQPPTFTLGGFGTHTALRAVPDTSWPLFMSTRHTVKGNALSVTDRLVLIDAVGRQGDSGGPIVDTRTGRVVSVVSRGAGDDDDTGEHLPGVGGPRLYTCKKAITETLAR